MVYSYWNHTLEYYTDGIELSNCSNEEPCLIYTTPILLLPALSNR